MALEVGTYISDLVVTNPTGGDSKSQGDDHLRLIKSTIKATFPNITGAVTATHTDINGATASIAAKVSKAGDTMSGALAMGSNKITGLANGTLSTDAAAFGQIATATASYLPLAGGTMSGALAMGSQKITGLANGVAATDAATVGQLTGTAQFKNGTFSRDMTTASGTQTITGIGFAPKFIRFSGKLVTANSEGSYDLTTNSCVYEPLTGSDGISSTESIHLEMAAGIQAASVTAVASGQFTLTWTKTSSPTGTGYILWEAIG